MALMPNRRSCLKQLPAVFAVAFVWGCTGGDDAPPPAVTVLVAEAERRDVPLILEMVGSTLGNQDVPIRARVEGFLESVDFQEGKRIKKGQLLYTIDPQPFQAKLVEAQSVMAAAETQLAFTQADLGRIKPLADINAVSQQDLDAAVAQEAAARAGVKAASAGVDLANIELSYARIYAPIDGVIGLTKAKPGEFVGREPNPVVLNTLSDINPIRVRFSISEREYLILARTYLAERGRGEREPDQSPEDGRQLTLILADGSEWDETGFADASSQSIDSETGTFTVEAFFPNPDSLLLPGQFARVRAPYQTLENVVVVPTQAIVELQGRFRVYVVNAESKVEIVAVEIGATQGNDIVIESGLEAGQSVIVEGVQKVRADMPVAPQPFTEQPKRVPGQGSL